MARIPRSFESSFRFGERVSTTMKAIEIVLALSFCFLSGAFAGDAPDSSSQIQSNTKADESIATALPHHKGAWEWGIASGGGIGAKGGARYKGFWNVQLHWGKVLTGVHGPGILAGTLEYRAEAEPVSVVRQSDLAIGAGFNPLILQYNFARGRRWMPFALVGGGVLVTGRQVPELTSKFNFTPQAGLGLNVFSRTRMAISTGVRFHHTSNAGFSRLNPGHNAIYFYSGVSWWR